MNEQSLRESLDAIAALNGMEACAVVDSDSGLVWSAAGRSSQEPLWEAAIDYWRLHGRSRAHFSELGPLGAAVLYHRDAVLAIMPCGRQSDLLSVCIAKHEGVDWLDVQRHIGAMSKKLVKTGDA